MYCTALWDRLEGVTSNVNQPFDWHLLSAEKYLQYFLSKLRSARVCILFDCVQSLLKVSCKAEATETFSFVISKHYTMYKSLICDVFVIHHLKTKCTACTECTVGPTCMWWSVDCCCQIAENKFHKWPLFKADRLIAPAVMYVSKRTNFFKEEL